MFRVTLDATKPAIAKAVADLFKVKVKAVNTVSSRASASSPAASAIRATISKKRS